MFPDRRSLDHVKESSCPGPYLLPDKLALPRPVPSQEFIQRYPREAEWYTQVISQGKPNYRGARLPISTLPLDLWKTKLQHYDDWQLTAFMGYGWPVGFEGPDPPDMSQQNHGSAANRPTHVDKYVDKEAHLRALAGPIKTQPFEWLRLNPMMTREKKDPGNFRVILDLSFPPGDSVNGQINKHLPEGAPYKLHLPTPLQLANIITRKGKGALLFKLDLARAYHQLPSDP